MRESCAGLFPVSSGAFRAFGRNGMIAVAQSADVWAWVFTQKDAGGWPQHAATHWPSVPVAGDLDSPVLGHRRFIGAGIYQEGDEFVDVCLEPIMQGCMLLEMSRRKTMSTTPLTFPSAFCSIMFFG